MGIRILIFKRRLTSSHIPLVTTIIGVCLLICLGTWQLYRLQWKENLIQTFDHRLAQPTQNLDHVLLTQTPIVEFTPVQITGTFLKDFKLKLQGRSHKGQIGYHLIMALRQTDGVTILVDRGWMPLAQTYETTPSSLTLKGYIRLKSDYNFMTPANQYNRGEIYRLDPLEVARIFNLKNMVPFYMVETGPVLKDVYPSLAQPVLHLRNNHLQYALIWYTLALALIVIYILFRQQGRRTVHRR